MKFFLPYIILFILLVLVEGPLLLPTVRGELCSEDLGPCLDPDTCNSNCKQKHPADGQGSCVVSGGIQICRCIFECPKRKQCNVGIGPCSAACNAACCDQNCAAKFPGPAEGHGLCNEVGAYSYCVCTYYC